MSKRIKVSFPAAQQAASQDDPVMLHGLLELPVELSGAFVLFAHCFTCGKDIAAASRVARTLVARGYGVLRFDFTGLGNSDGDFANTNFSSNVNDLIAAADYLREHYQAPSVLVGHSLGGAAVLKAAARIPESVAVATIAAPSNAAHVTHNFSTQLGKISKDGEANVNLAGRIFTIKQQFIEDLCSQDTQHIAKLRRALLVMHSPSDQTVSINEAEHIYSQAKHPKSFVTLDNADHLLTSKEDAEYVAQTIATWAARYIPVSAISTRVNSSSVSPGEVLVKERNQNFTQDIHSDSHYWLSDEPLSVGGDNLGPDPYEQLLASVGACTSMTLRMYAKLKKLPLQSISVTLSHQRNHLADCQQCDEQGKGIEVINRDIKLEGDLSITQRERLLAIADKCPVHRTLSKALKINSRLLE